MTQILKSTSYTFLMLPLLFSMAVQAANPADPYGNEDADLIFDDSHLVPWAEQQLNIPTLPVPDKMTHVVMDEIKHFKVFIDEDTLTNGEKDEVTRYWIRLESKRGGGSMMYEAIRCHTNEYKTYAYGYPDKQPDVRPVRKPKWHEFKPLRSGNYRKILSLGYLCANKIARGKESVSSSLHGRAPRDLYFEDVGL